MPLLRRSLAALATLIAVFSAAPAAAADWKFEVRFTKAVREEPYTGRVYLFFSKVRDEPRKQWWFFNLRREPCASIDVRDWKPGDTLSISAEKSDLLAFPEPLAKMDLAEYRVQAVVRFNPLDPTIGGGEGNGYSQAVLLKDAGDTPALVVDKLVPPREFKETKWTKLLRVRSKLLSDFHGRDVYLNAAVVFPASYYDRPEQRFPTIFTIPGFGGTHHSGVAERPVEEKNERGVEFLRVMLDSSCPLGHHAFSDSANNGPYGRAFVEELIPAFERKFRSIASPTARFLTGHSSGGWSSLWVQITHPDRFAGTWSTAPDPVDFRDFQQINLYRPGENMYFDRDGEKRPIARAGGRVVMKYKEFAWNEWALGTGGQLHSFEAVFSPRGREGKPLLVWDRKTGEIDTAVARTWEKYDIRLVLERNWKTLGPQLERKLHVFMGDEDTFYLEGATKRLKESLEKLESDAVVEIHEGKDHGSLLTRELRDRIRREMVARFLAEHPEWGRE